MPFYQVRKGHTWGHGSEKKTAGGVVELTAYEAEGFGFKLESIEIPDETTTSVFRVNPDDPNLNLDTVRLHDVQWDVSKLGHNPEDDEGGEAWADLSDRVIDVLEAAGLVPEDVEITPDDYLLSLPGIGPATLAKIREFYPLES